MKHDCTIKSYVEGPKWAGIPAFIRKVAFTFDLEVIELNEEKGWIRSTTFFKLGGKESDCIEAKKVIEESLDAYNS